MKQGFVVWPSTPSMVLIKDKWVMKSKQIENHISESIKIQTTILAYGWWRDVPVFPIWFNYSFQRLFSLSHGNLTTGSDEFPALDLMFNKGLCTVFGFLVLLYKCKGPPWQHCNVYFIGFISSFFTKCCFVFSLYCVFLLLTVMTCICFIPPPHAPVFQCVLISNVCGFDDGFMKKDKRNKRNRKLECNLEMGGGWSGHYHRFLLTWICM